MGRRSIPSATLFAAVRAYFNLTQDELAKVLGVTRAFVSHIEAGRNATPDAVLARLTLLARHLPDTPEAAAPVVALRIPLDTGIRPPAHPAPDFEALKFRLDECDYRIRRLRSRLRPFETRAHTLARWQAVAPALLAELPPADPLSLLEQAPLLSNPDQAPYKVWWRARRPRALIEERAAPFTPAELADWHLLRLRAEALEYEAAALRALLAAA